jgi:hypothetical protein
MAITINTTSSDTISPEEFLEWVLENVDPADDESMISASERLCALNNNRDFIIKKLRQEMVSLLCGNDDRISSAQGTIHADGDCPRGRFLVRSVIWSPSLVKNSRAAQMQNKTLSFATPHDHNFGLLTIGHHGPGYETVIHEYCRDDIVGRSDEPISIKYLETTTLSEGKILYFRPSLDIHSQFHPSELSISLNLIGQVRNIASIPQYEFDIERQRIKSLYPNSTVMSLLVPFKIIECMDTNLSVVDIVSDLAKKHQSPYIRSAAYKTLATMCPNEFEKLIMPGMDDQHQFVLNTVQSLYARILN